MSNIYERIDELCKQHNTNVTAMCRELKIQRSSLSELKAGRAKSISADKVAKIADFFNVSASYITTGVTSTVTTSDSVEKIDINDIRYAAYQEMKDISDDEIKDVIDYIRYKKSQKKD